MRDRTRRLLSSVILLVLLAHPVPVSSAIIEVNETCTLVDAIHAANNDDDSGGSCPPGGSGADTIVLTDDVELDGVDNGFNGLPVITSDVTIEGNGFEIARAPIPDRFRLFDVQVALTLNRVTLRNGYGPRGGGVYVRGGDLTLQDSAVISSAAAPEGGGIAAILGTVTIRNSTVSGNRATIGGGLWAVDSHVSIANGTIEDNDARDGGAIWATGPRDLVVEESLIRGNTSIVSGGAIALHGGIELTVAHTTLNENQAGDKGGAIFASRTSGSANRVTVMNCTLERNTAFDNGGAIFSRYGELIVRNSTLAANVAGFEAVLGIGGGLAVQNGLARVESSAVVANSATLGGGIDVSGFDGSPARLTLTNSTVSGNAAEGYGGGLLNSFESTIDTVHSTLFGNAAPSGSQIRGSRDPGQFTVINTIIAGGVGGDACSFAPIVGSGNFADVDGCGPATPIVPGVDIDTMLADNGGPTMTHALLPGSVAQDGAGDCGLDVDQRGFPRDDGACDGGSFELQPPPVCGDDMVNQEDEECDGADDAACPGRCDDASCLCIPPNGACCTDGPGVESDCIIATVLDCEADGGLFLGLDTECRPDIDCTALEVTMESMAAVVVPAGVVVRWTTALETDTVGFRVLRETGGRREKALEQVGAFVAALGSEVEGGSYEVLDASPAAVDAVHYFIEDIDLFGRVTRHGPIAVDRVTRQRPATRTAT